MPFVVYQAFTESLIGDGQIAEQPRAQAHQGYVEVIGTGDSSGATFLLAYQNYLQALGNIEIQTRVENNQAFIETVGYANEAPRAYNTNVYVENIGFSVDIRAYNASVNLETLGYANEPSIMRSAEVYVENIGIGIENQVAFSEQVYMEFAGLPYPARPPETRVPGTYIETIGWENQTNPENEEDLTWHVWIS